MQALKIGVIGAGLIAQVEHIPNLLRLSQLFHLVGVADPSAQIRAALEARGITAYPDESSLLAQPLDAVLVATPDAYHAEGVIAALARGLHVFTEKPLCYDPADARRIAAARDQARRVVQVGYMKRFDPNYELLQRLLPATGAELLMVSVEVQDPGSWPFDQHQGTRFPGAADVPPDLIAEGRGRSLKQVASALEPVSADADLRGYAGPYCSSLIHDINAVHGLLDHLGIHTGQPTGAAFFAQQRGGHASLRLSNAEGTCQGLWQMTWLEVPKIAEYKERITLYFPDAVYELNFPSPYLNHFPTRLTVSRSEAAHWTHTEHRANYEEAFVRELQAFWESVTQGRPVRNPVEEAERDLCLAANLARLALEARIEAAA